jgi:hypothetical protein
MNAHVESPWPRRSRPNPEKRLIIRVRTVPEGERLLIKVADPSIGIDPENPARIFPLTGEEVSS